MMGSVATARRDADALLAIVDSGRSPEATIEELQLTSATAATLPTAIVSRPWSALLFCRLLLRSQLHGTGTDACAPCSPGMA